MTDCIFCSIIAKEEGFLYEDPWCVVIKDKYPQAKTHVLILPKRHIESLYHIRPFSVELLIYKHMMSKVPFIAYELGLIHWTTKINTGAASGQVINHLHVHLTSDQDLHQ